MAELTVKDRHLTTVALLSNPLIPIGSRIALATDSMGPRGQWVTCSVERMMTITGCKNRRAFLHARKRIIEKGLLEAKVIHQGEEMTLEEWTEREIGKGQHFYRVLHTNNDVVAQSLTALSNSRVAYVHPDGYDDALTEEQAKGINPDKAPEVYLTEVWDALAIEGITDFSNPATRMWWAVTLPKVVKDNDYLQAKFEDELDVACQAAIDAAYIVLDEQAKKGEIRNWIGLFRRLIEGINTGDRLAVAVERSKPTAVRDYFKKVGTPCVKDLLRDNAKGVTKK